MSEIIAEKKENKKYKRWFVVLIAETIAFGFITALKIYAAYDTVLFLVGYSVTTLLPFYLLQLVAMSVLCAKMLEEDKKSGMLGAMSIGALPFMMNVLFVLVILSAIWIPGLTVKRKSQASEKSHQRILAVMTVFLVLLLFLPPHNFVSFSVGLGPKSSQKYWDQFIESFATSGVGEIQIDSYNSDENYGTARDYILTEQLRGQIAEILKEAPVEYYSQNPRGSTPSSSLSLDVTIRSSLYSSNVFFWFDYDKEREYSGKEGTTFISLNTYPYEKNIYSYFTMDNRHLDKIFALVKDYEIDETLFIQFREDIISAKAENFSASVVIGGNMYPVTVTQEALNQIGEIFNKFFVDYTHFENPEDFPKGKLEAHITMRDNDTTLDIIYDDRRNGEGEQSGILRVEGESLIRICARGKTEYYRLPNIAIDQIMNELGVSAPTVNMQALYN